MMDTIIREDYHAGKFGKNLLITWFPGRTETVMLSRNTRASRRSLISTWWILKAPSFHTAAIL